jgi:hypothetical protein
MESVPTLFFSPFCPHCQSVLEAIGPLFNDRDLELLVRTPSHIERKQIQQLPALYLPERTFNLKQPHVLVGSEIPSLLNTLAEQ